MDTRRVSVPGTSVGVQAALEALSAQWAEHGLSRAVTWPVEIAVDEVLAYVVHHALDGRGVVARVDLEIGLETGVDPPSCEVVVSDDGPEFDPLAVAELASSPVPEQRPSGAPGLSLVLRLMEEVSYQRREGRNWLRLRRRLVPMEA